MSTRFRKGFTLIELLIVVAIIAILAAIAVPNFLEAQTRAKVSRSKNDLRSLAMAIEAYRVDDNEYPILPLPAATRFKIPDAHGWPRQYGLWFILTTPVSYITSIPHDAFFRLFSQQWGIWQDYYRVWNLANHTNSSLLGSTPWGYPSTVTLAKNGGIILMASVGPDRVEDAADGSAAGSGIGIRGLIPYDPINGTVSWGDIYYVLPGVGFDIWPKIW